MSIIVKTKNKEVIFISRSFFSKKIQGLGILFDCDVAQGMMCKTILVINIKLLFFVFWMSIDCKKINHIVNVKVTLTDIQNAVRRIATANKNRKSI